VEYVRKKIGYFC